MKIPDRVWQALCVFKALHNKTCDEINQLILLLHREFYIDIAADIEIKILRLRINQRGQPSKVIEFQGYKGVKQVLKDLVKNNTITIQEINKGEQDDNEEN